MPNEMGPLAVALSGRLRSICTSVTLASPTGAQMKKLLLGSVATGALIAAGSANAADLAVKAPRVAPVAPPVPVFSWTGCFVGAHVGWGWGRHDVTESFTCVSI